MSKHVTARPTAPKPKPTKYKAGRRVRPSGANRASWIIIAVVIVIGVAAVVAVASGRHNADKTTLAPAALVKKVTTVPTSVYRAVGAGDANAVPKSISAPALTANGKPQVLYVGAEYCPYCATERWAMIAALSRFGTFSGLKTTHSSSVDVFPNTPTFSFHGATYTSRWLTFTGIETETNQQQGDGYAPLDRLTSAQQQVFDTYDRAPYVGTDSSSSGGIPFIDFGGRFTVGGVTYDPSVLQGKSANAIADALSDPTSAIARGAIGSANTFAAAICSLTDNQPAKVCSDPSITKIGAAM